VREGFGIGGTRFLLTDFQDFGPQDPYDVVVSLANHATIDGRSAMNFEEYVLKCFHLLAPRGLLLFETHNVFGPGRGAPGDDGDLDAKLDLMARYFEVLDHRMIRAFVPLHDIDKLFIVLRRRDTYRPEARRSFDLATARVHYG
jgi:hypothetical protein